MDKGQTIRIDGDPYAAAFEHRVARLHPVREVDPIAVSRASGYTHGEPQCRQCPALCQLLRDMSCRRLAQRNLQRSARQYCGAARRTFALDLDLEGGTSAIRHRAAGQARVRVQHARLVQQVSLVVVARRQRLDALADHDDARPAGPRRLALVRQIQIVAKELSEQALPFAQGQRDRPGSRGAARAKVNGHVRHDNLTAPMRATFRPGYADLPMRTFQTSGPLSRYSHWNGAPSSAWNW